MRALAAFADRPAVPWANGAGETTELVALTESASLTPGLRPWRLSIARLDRTGPFSALPGMARTFLPTAEVVLEIDGRTRRANPTRPAAFHGGQSVSVVELTEHCFAVNLMVADPAADAGVGALMDVDVDDGDDALVDGDDTLMMSVGAPIPTQGFRFVLTLHPTSDHPRFSLFALEPDDLVPEDWSVVVLSGVHEPQ